MPQYTDEYRSIHEALFHNVFTHAGVYRMSNISKREWVVQYDTVTYGDYPDIIPDLEKAMLEESEMNNYNLTEDEDIERFADFIAKIWKIHPFYEGNTRATALFAIKYLRSMGYEIDNETFRQHSWFFRTALARANYSNKNVRIEKDSSHLYNFFKNLLKGENCILKNRDILILSPEGWSKKENIKPEDEMVNVDKEISRISDVKVYKHNGNIHSIKCRIDNIEQKSIHLKMKDLMSYYKIKESSSTEEMGQFLIDLATTYFKENLISDELKSSSKTSNLHKR